MFFNTSPLMHYLRSYFLTAQKIIEQYSGEMPLGAFLKNYFSKEKKYGSRDRKMIASLCYNYFRLGVSLQTKTTEEKLLTGLFLLSNTSNDFLEEKAKQWNQKVTYSIDEKAQIAGVDLESIFPFNQELSDGIDAVELNRFFLTQPNLFIRIRPGKNDIVKTKLQARNIIFTKINPQCLSFANGTKLENILAINNDAVIQDMNSQRVSDMFALMSLPERAKVWDCCAASGGKSIMAYDFIPGISLWVSDIRPYIINNLQKRLKEAAIKNYKSFVADMTNAGKLKQEIDSQIFDLIICDAPCSGSGTWGRTPEQLIFFKEKEIASFSKMQTEIVLNAVPYLKKGGYMLYITCSVFKKENEDIAAHITANTSLQLIKKEILKGYNDKADTMFAALFQSQ